MKLIYIIPFISIFVWLLPPFRQYKTYYFGYFLILAIADPIKLFFMNSFSIAPQIFSPFFSLLLVSSLTKMERRLPIFVLAFLLLLVLLSFSLPFKLIQLVNSLAHIWILIIVISRFIDSIVDTKSLNLFLMLLVVYEFTGILKNIVVLLDIVQGITQFYVATTIQIIFGILFIFINYNNSKLFSIKNQLVKG